jgi:hypothetical protein
MENKEESPLPMVILLVMIAIGAFALVWFTVFAE